MNLETKSKAFIDSDYDLKSYSYDLPQSFIAQAPALPRDQAKIMVFRRKDGSIQHAKVCDLPDLLAENKFHFVLNNTRVFRARLKGHRLVPTPQGEQPGGKLEFFLLEKVDPNAHAWKGMMKSSAAITPGFRFQVGKCLGIVLEVSRMDQGIPLYTAVFDQDPLAHGNGEVPLPPYISSKEEMDVLDSLYNTTYAKVPGSVAAPTAGRHLTDELIQKLRAKGQEFSEITLHVGIGTFLPVKSKDIRSHVMHSERAVVSEEAAKQITAAREKDNKVLAVGTTSARTLEFFSDAYGVTRSGEENTELFIYPGYQWKGVDALLTNFHLPESSLLMMVASFLGDRKMMLDLYEHAKKEKYRFFSFGDAMLIL